jgi:protoporphyrinogen oxidase
MSEPIVVIGAGPAGMSAAWQLARRGIDVHVIEKDTAVGGMSKTVCRAPGFCYDYGPHTFHIRETETSREVVAEVLSLLGDEYRVLERGTRLYLNGQYLTYPPQFKTILRKVRLGMGARIVADYAYASLRYALSPAQEEDSFEDWGVRNLGRTLYDTFFGLYSEKVWGIPMSQVSSRQAQRVAKLNLRNIVLRMLKVKADPETYFIQYLYPNDGIGELYRRMADVVRARGGAVHLNATAVRVLVHEGRVHALEYERDGREHMLPCRGLISTMPLADLVPSIATTQTSAGQMRTSPAMSVTSESLDAASLLGYRSLVLVLLAVNRPRVTDYHWCYLIEPQFECCRFSEQKNVNPDMLPPDRTVLCVEASCQYGDERWRASDADLVEMAIADLERMGILDRQDVYEHWVARIQHAYPIYRLGFERVLYRLLGDLTRIDNLYTIGRHGLFVNNSMDDNVAMGMRVAAHIADHEPREAWWRDVLRWTQLESLA